MATNRKKLRQLTLIDISPELRSFFERIEKEKGEAHGSQTKIWKARLIRRRKKHK